MHSTSAYDSTYFTTLYTTREIDPSSSHFRVRVKLSGSNRSTELAAMIDSGATSPFLDQNFAKRLRIRTFPLRHPITVYNIDGTKNRAGKIDRCASLQLTVDQMSEWMDFLVTDLGGEDIILGLPWLRAANPNIDWEKGLLQVRGRSDKVYDEDEIWVTDEEIRAMKEEEEEGCTRVDYFAPQARRSYEGSIFQYLARFTERAQATSKASFAYEFQ